CSINVTPKSISAESIELNTASLNLNIGESEKLIATVETKETTELVTWTSDNEAVATVDQNGLVTGIAVGQVSIAAKCGDVSAKCEVTVIDPTETGYSFNISDMIMRKGDTSVLPVEMINDGEVVAFQCDVILPDGMSIAQDSQGEDDIQKSDRFSSSHSLQSRKLANGNYRIVSLSMQNKSYQGNDGVIFSIPIVVDENIEAESAIISVENIRMTKPSGEEVQPPTVSANITIVSYTPGDVNGDGTFTVTDAAMIVSYILEQYPYGGIREAADVNEDGIITVTDAALVVQYILDDKPVNNASSHSQSRLPKATPMESSTLRIEDNKAYLAIPNASRFVAGQFELELPMDAEVASIRLVGDNSSSHMLSWQKNADGKVKAVILSLGNECLSGDEVVEITFDTHGSIGQVIASEIRFIENEDNEFTESSFCNVEATMDISGIASPANGLQIFTEGHNLIIISDGEMILPLSTIDGKVRLLDVHSGRNTYSLSAGFYLIGGQKVFVHYR
ncbi:MAG: Ig-like domain-containing protein, partial [Bacteroidaceae bacterium]|nr:Ig-like domain-containing protein [Bacteroidaceae bacterium]